MWYRSRVLLCMSYQPAKNYINVQYFFMELFSPLFKAFFLVSHILTSQTHIWNGHIFNIYVRYEFFSCAFVLFVYNKFLKIGDVWVRCDLVKFQKIMILYDILTFEHQFWSKCQNSFELHIKNYLICMICWHIGFSIEKSYV